MKKSTAKKLTLRTTSLRRLDDAALTGAAGGNATWGACTTTSDKCSAPKVCSVAEGPTRYINPNPFEHIIVLAPFRGL